MSSNHKSRMLAVAWGTLWLAAAAGQAAEIQLRHECRPRGAVVTLGDIAEVQASDAQAASRLAEIELFPTPPSGRQRFVRLREIQDLLLVRGIGLADHRFSGASQVAVLGPGETKRPVEPRPLSPAAVKSAQRQVSEAVVQFLRENVPGNEGWTAEAAMDGAAARAISGATGRVWVRGGAAPWVGNQRFEAIVETPDGPQSFPVEARVSKLGMVVVSTRSLLRGTVIRPEDVQLQRVAAGEDTAGCFRTIGDVIGLETTRAVSEGRPLDRETVRAPLAVRRGELITVYARGAGLRVRTTARAREDASIGDLVSVESLLDRRVFAARVCGIQEAEVFARAIQAEPAARAAHDPTTQERRDWR